ATRTPGSGFAHVVRVTLGADDFTKSAQIALTDVTNPVRIAVEPSGDRLAVGIDRTLEIWRGNERGEIRYAYDQPLMTVCWANTGLFIGEGRSVHQVDPDTAAPVRSAALQSGWIVNVTAMEAGRPVVGNRVPSKLPGQVLFHAEAVGQEVKAFRVGQDVPRGSPWHVSFDRDEMPWLVIHPTSGITPNVVYMGVDPGRYTPGSLASNMLTVETAHQTQPHDIDLRILPLARSEVRRILWIWPDEVKGRSFRDVSDPHGMRDLGELLAAPPHLFSHREAVVPVSEPLDPFTVVVLDAAAAIRGAVTRQALLEYVMHGGSLLLIGRYLPDADPETLAAWLQPVQVEIDTHTLLEGPFIPTRDARAVRHWRDVRLSDGCAVYTDDAMAIAVRAEGNPRQAALLLRPYGRGRIAILAAPTPLSSASLRNAEHRLFAEDLFDWLAQAGTHTGEQDMDGDSIPDDIEDGNGNGLVDPGETDYLNPDTDGDGVDDGMEDTNLNGVMDDGETSPLNPDSNSNGILDGADPAPLPMEGAPVVTGVTPAQCPAEGGVLALISGRNFAPGATVRFGDAIARNVHVLRGTDALVEVPPCPAPAGGDVPVRVCGPSGGAEAVLPAGFHYGPLSHVKLALQGPAAAEKREGVYYGTISIRLDAPAGVTVNQVLLLLKAAPSDGFAWEERPPAGAPETRKRLVTRITQWGDLLVVVLSEKPGEPLRGGLGEIAWRMTPPAGTTGPLRFTEDQPRVMTLSNWPLDVAVRPVTVALP
ncbi:MAG: IPT/TIG domain-containing protein, partial [Candidatus Hydrogenedentes bacterium]|nr:IPT/TIG domain-containing protein [Candidatus Hydrogenedentota bacterium]